MEYPTLGTIQTSRDMINEFKGYNHNLIISESEFFNMENMTSDNYPTLSTRKPRARYGAALNAKAIIAKDALAYVAGQSLIYNGETVYDALSTEEPKQLISMAAYLIVFPDGFYVNTKDLTDKGYLGLTHTVNENLGNVSFKICDIDGAEYDYVSQATAPENPDNGTYWLDTSETVHSLKVYSSLTAMWNSVPTVYVKISYPGIGIGFSKYDGVKIKIQDTDGSLKNYDWADLWNGKTSILYGCGDDYIIVVGILDSEQTITDKITIAREIPIMDYVCENQNRLWGCRYGTNAEGKVVNEIYASKQGDPKNWNCFMGLSTDSYAVSLGSDGVFTGATSHAGYPLFFKENCFHKIYGSMPSEYQTQEVKARGVQKGSFRSLVTVNETLFYKSDKCVCAYDGSLPVSVSDALGNEIYTDAVAGTLGDKYYISMKDSGGEWHLFACDTNRGVWHREDNTHAIGFAALDGDLFYFSESNIQNTYDLFCVNGTQGIKRPNFDWYVESGIIGYLYPDNKYVSRFNVRMIAKPGTKVSLYIQYDSNPKWEHKGTMEGKTLRSFTLPVIPRRCDHFRIKIAGHGEVQILSISKTLEIGSDVV